MMNARYLPFLFSLLGLGILLSGCAGSPVVEDHDYLLRPQKMTVSSGSRSVVHLKPVTVAPYLAQKGLVLQTGSSEINVAKHHRWAEPLDEAVERYLQVSVANQADVAVESAPLITEEDGCPESLLGDQVSRSVVTRPSVLFLLRQVSIAPSPVS